RIRARGAHCGSSMEARRGDLIHFAGNDMDVAPLAAALLMQSIVNRYRSAMFRSAAMNCRGLSQASNAVQ
ncbi:MAG: hypothetical protein ABW184_09075, partial [Sphingobium sp.]